MATLSPGNVRSSSAAGGAIASRVPAPSGTTWAIVPSPSTRPVNMIRRLLPARVPVVSVVPIVPRAEPIDGWHFYARFYSPRDRSTTWPAGNDITMTTTGNNEALDRLIRQIDRLHSGPGVA